MSAASQTIRSPEPQIPCDCPAGGRAGRSGSFGSSEEVGLHGAKYGASAGRISRLSAGERVFRRPQRRDDPDREAL